MSCFGVTMAIVYAIATADQAGQLDVPKARQDGRAMKHTGGSYCPDRRRQRLPLVRERPQVISALTLRDRESGALLGERERRGGVKHELLVCFFRT
jgi:hypothetical protein